MALCECGCGQETKLAKKTSVAQGTVKGQPLRFVHNHHGRLRTSDHGYSVADNGCWLWHGPVHQNGYGRMSFGKSDRRWVHRVYYERLRGPIPDGLTIHHRCETKRCVNPEHMQLVTPAEHVRITRPKGRPNGGAHMTAKTHCPQGHPYDATDSRGFRICSTCTREQKRRWYASTH